MIIPLGPRLASSRTDRKDLIASRVHQDLSIAAILRQNEKLVPPVAALGLTQVYFQNLTWNSPQYDRQDTAKWQRPTLRDRFAGSLGSRGAPATPFTTEVARALSAVSILSHDADGPSNVAPRYHQGK
jgi:hypothetical protein